MNKRFNDKVILTTQNPEAFLNFGYTGDASMWIYPSCNLPSGQLYVNGIDMNAYITQQNPNFALNLDGNITTASFHVYTRVLNDFDYNLRFIFYNSIDCLTLARPSIDVSIHNRQNIANLNAYDNESVLVDGQSSYLVLRTNPKFTGNIKLIVDTSDNIFLDTFKVSDILSNKKYRKQQVSGNSVLSNDVRNVFRSMPLGELYSVGNKSSFNIGIPKTKYSDQYDTTYNYGARLLEDELYPQDNALLAPLWINSVLPEYFSVFRLDGVYNSETYNNTSLINLASKYLENSDLIKTWNLKPTSPLGNYLNTHLSDLVKTPAPVFLSLTDPSISTAESDPNTWYGIAVDKGVLTGRSETPYFFNKTIDNFTELNAFVSNGFERNNLLCPNLLNLEFIFDDNDVSEYTMSRYFGLYLTENVLYNISYYSDTADSSVNILSLDGKDINAFIDSSIFDSLGNISSAYKNRIFVINEGDKLIRITNANQINNNVDYVSVAKENIFAAGVTKEVYAPFITLTINNKLQQGEQLRIINKTKNKIWEVYGIDNGNMSCNKYVSQYSSLGYPTIAQTTFNVAGSIADQIKSLEIAFDRFADYEDNVFRSGVRGDNWMSIILNDDADAADDWVFQRITAQTLNVFTDPLSGFNNVANENDITFFGRLTPAASDVQIVNFDALYGPINFELYGNRRSIFIDLFDRQNNMLYSFIPEIADKFVDHMLYQGEDGWYKLTQDFIIDTSLATYDYQYVLDPLSLETRYLIQTKENIRTISDTWNAYSIKDINISLMGINSVKDIDYTVNDANLGFQSEYWYKRDGDASTYQITILANNNKLIDIRNSYQILSGIGVISPANGNNYSYAPNTKFNTFFGNATLYAITDTTVAYNVLNGSRTSSSYKSGTSEENVTDYYISNSMLKYSLTTPTVSKWAGLGSDCRNNEFRLIFNASSLDVPFTDKSNFIPVGSLFNDEISYPSFKYLSPGDRNWQDYIFYDINDTIFDSDASVYKTIKEQMFAKPYVDVFSKLVYSNNNVDSIKNRSSIANYTDYNQSINVLLLGLSMSFKIRDSAKNILNAKNYDKYRFSFISTSSKNRDDRRPIEIIINENTETILMIWYQGNDVLNYSFRNSTFLPGKSLLDPCSNYFVTGTTVDTSTQYSFTKTPFVVNNSTPAKILYNVYNNTMTYDNSIGNPYMQFNYNPYNVSSIWNAFTTNNVISSTTITSGLSYNTFSQTINYSYYPNINAFGNRIVNYGYKYQTNENLYTNSTCSLEKLSYFTDPARDFISFYIIRENIILTNNDFSLPPIILTINSPRKFNSIYTYNGWYAPKLNNVLEFKNNEDAYLVSTVEKDFILSNTNLKSYKSIDQYWFNDVVSTVTDMNAATGNAISYSSNFNVFNAQWDAKYYVKSDTSTLINGYNATVELPSFFGSKLIKLPDYLEISSWDTNTVSIQNDGATLIMSFNLSKAISELFKNNSTFLNNWIGLSAADTIIDSYINDTILFYYNISISKIKLNLYYKSFDSELLHSVFDSNFIEDMRTNYKANLTLVKNEYIYKIIILTGNNYSYFVKFTMFEK